MIEHFEQRLLTLAVVQLSRWWPAGIIFIFSVTVCVFLSK